MTTFKININPGYFKFDRKSLINLVKQSALYYIAREVLLGDATVMNEYLVANYKKDLKTICTELINSANYTKMSDTTILVFWLAPQDNKMASLITYGVGKVKGCNTLRNAFK